MVALHWQTYPARWSYWSRYGNSDFAGCYEPAVQSLAGYLKADLYPKDTVTWWRRRLRQLLREAGPDKPVAFSQYLVAPWPDVDQIMVVTLRPKVEASALVKEPAR
jgi:hypothetical protein